MRNVVTDFLLDSSWLGDRDFLFGETCLESLDAEKEEAVEVIEDLLIDVKILG